MKNLIFAIAVAFSVSAFAGAGDTTVETKKVCIKVYDGKQKKDVEKCKQVKKHKKHDGQTVPTK